jgi:hypothetical protein
MKTASDWADEMLERMGESDVSFESDLAPILAAVIEQIQADAIRSAPPPTELRLTDEDLAAIEARHGATTQGKWRVAEHGMSGARYLMVQLVGWQEGGRESILGSMSTGEVSHNLPNAEFCAHAHQDVPALLADLKTARRLLDECWQDGNLQRLEEVKAAAFAAGVAEGEKRMFDHHWQPDGHGGLKRKRVNRILPSTDEDCEWCNQVKPTTMGEVWSNADVIGHLVRGCEECTSRCAGG